MSTRDQLNSYIRQLEGRLRLSLSLRGAAILTSAALAATVVLVLITNAFAFSRGSITTARVALLFALALAVSFGLAVPLKALNRRWAAGQAENAFPEFKQRLVTFAERDAGGRQPFLELLAADTLQVASNAEPKSLVPDRELLAFLGTGAASLAILLWMILAGPGFLGYGAGLLWAVSSHTNSVPFYDIQVTPGDAAVRRNADQVVTAQLIGLQPDAVRLYARYQSATKWEQVTMRPETGGSGYQFVFGGLPESVEYYVEAGPMRTRHYTLRVLDLPLVKNIRVTYRYPDWTHLHNVVEERGGDLRAVEGTDADLEIQTDRPLRDGILVLDNEQQIRLTAGEGNVYKGTVHLEKDGVYHVAAVDQGQPVRLSEDYFIEAQKANPPDVLIARPGRDYRASPIEEVTVQVKAEDQFGVNEMALHYSVNGGPEKTVDLLKQKGVKQADGSTLIALEDYKLVPGDLVSMYATAKDSRAESRTDMFFVQAEPFEREFSQSQQMGGGGGGGGGAMGQDDISQREKEIIAQTWKELGDKKATKQESAEAAKFLANVQAKLRDQALSLSGRMQSRELNQQNDEFNGFVKDMSAAADAMGPASEKLGQQNWKDAIPDEQKALQHLLRAEATFRQIEVAFGGRGGGSGFGGAGRDLASLFDLELDTEKNQYETAQTAGASQNQRDKEIDETLQKLDQLARRQEELAQQQRNSGALTSEERWQQEMLRREAEELQRRMEQMARSNSQGQGSSGSQGNSSSSASGQSGSSGSQGSGDPRVQQSLDRLRQATDDMRRAASQPRNDAEARRAADRLREATNLLNGMRQQQNSSRLGGLADETSRLANQQREQSDRIRQLFGSQGGLGAPRAALSELRKLADDRQKLSEDLSRLEKDLQDNARDLATNNQRAASSKLREALGDMQQSDLRSRIQRGSDYMRRGIDPSSAGLEPEISAGMQRLDKTVHDALQAMGNDQPPTANPREGLQTALDRVERLRNQMDSLTRNSQGSQQGQGGGQQGGRGGQQNNQGGAWSQVGGPGARLGDGNYGGGYDVGPRGGYNYGGFDTGNNTPQGGPPVQPDTSPIPPQRAYQDALNELNQLRQAVPDDPETKREIQDLIREMQSLDPKRFPGNPALVEQLHTQVLAEVDKLDLELRRQLDAQQGGQVRSGDSRPAPPGYEDSVAEYYRRLSKNK